MVPKPHLASIIHNIRTTDTLCKHILWPCHRIARRSASTRRGARPPIVIDVPLRDASPGLHLRAFAFVRGSLVVSSSRPPHSSSFAKATEDKSAVRLSFLLPFETGVAFLCALCALPPTLKLRRTGCGKGLPLRRLRFRASGLNRISGFEFGISRVSARCFLGCVVRPSSFLRAWG